MVLSETTLKKHHQNNNVVTATSSRMVSDSSSSSGLSNARIIGSAVAGLSELTLFHPVDTIAKRLMSTETKIIALDSYATTTSNLNHGERILALLLFCVVCVNTLKMSYLLKHMYFYNVLVYNVNINKKQSFAMLLHLKSP